jgi:hypothetical protein
MDFDVLFAEDLVSLCDIAGIAGGANKSALSIANDYEDGKWRTEKFLDFIWDNIAETALSSSERDALVRKPKSSLKAAAQKLRLTDAAKDPGKGSEVAEILLYAVMKHHYGALSVVPKIFYKQNANDYAKGADSVHIVVDGNKFGLWLGEAKFFRSITDVRLKTIIRSVENMLDSQKLRKENSIITSLKDLDSVGIPLEMVINIREALSNRESIDNIKPIINVPILLLHQCSITKSHDAFDVAYKADIIKFQKDRVKSYFTLQAAKLSASVSHYALIKFHLILVPVPEKKTIVDSFLAYAKQTIGAKP